MFRYHSKNHVLQGVVTFDRYTCGIRDISVNTIEACDLILENVLDIFSDV